MSTTLTRKAMDAVASLNYSQDVNRLKEICMAKGMSAERFDRVMRLKLPSSETLRQMQDEGKLPSNEELSPLIHK